MTENSLTIVILCRNQERQVRALLPSITPHAQQIIVVDDDSTDEIEKLCKENGLLHIRRSLDDDFASQRNAALEHATGTWTLFFDADEKPEDGLMEELQSFIMEKKYRAVAFPRRDIFLGKMLRYGETSTVQLIRAAVTESGKGKWRRAVHETWDIPTQKTCTAKHAILHTSHTSLHTMFVKFHRYAWLESKLRADNDTLVVLAQLAVYPIAKFLLNYLIRGGWRDGWRGFIHAWMMSYLSAVTRVATIERKLEL